MAKNSYVVGIAGGSASGKTSFLKRLKASLPDGSVTIVSQDNYYLPRSEQQRDENGEVNYDLPSSFDTQKLRTDLDCLLAGGSISFKEYVFNNLRRTAETRTLHAAPLILVEGLFVFHYPAIRELLELRVYLDVREEIKLQRRIKRDRDERGYPEHTVRYQWEHHVLPSYKKFLKPYRDDSHIIITNNITFDKGLAVLRDHLLYKLESAFTATNSSAGKTDARPFESHSGNNR